jgi:hypothetical protein
MWLKEGNFGMKASSFNDWWNKIIKEWAFPSAILNDKSLMSFLKMVARDAYDTGSYTEGKEEVLD